MIKRNWHEKVHFSPFSWHTSNREDKERGGSKKEKDKKEREIVPHIMN